MAEASFELAAGASRAPRSWPVAVKTTRTRHGCWPEACPGSPESIPIVGEGESSPLDNLVHLGTISDDGGGMEVLRRKRSLASWKDREQEACKRLNIASDLGDEGFVFDAAGRDGGGDLVLGGHTRQGTMYAAVTAAQRLCLEGDSLSIRHIDSPLQPRINVPLFPNRSIATNIGGPDWIEPERWENEWGRPDGSYDWRGFVDFLAGHKLNNLNAWIFNLAWGIAYESARFPEMVNRHHPNVKREFMKDMMVYAEDRGIDVWFFADFPENWAGIIKHRPHLAGKNVDLSDFPTGETWEIIRRADRFPHFVNIDWGSEAFWLRFHSRRQVPRGSWFMQHGYGRRWQEAMVRIGVRTLAAFGQTGYQLRTVDFQAQDETYHALGEFTWNPSLDEDGFAWLHVIRRYHRDDREITGLYASWIKVNGARALLEHGDLDGWIDQAEERRILGHGQHGRDSRRRDGHGPGVSGHHPARGRPHPLDLLPPRRGRHPLYRRQHLVRGRRGGVAATARRSGRGAGCPP